MRIWGMFIALLVLLTLAGNTPASGQPPAATGEITGRIFDQETGQPLPGANVVVEGTNLGRSTDENGRFRIQRVPAGPQTVVIRYIGFEPQTEEITVSPGGVSRITVNLSGSARILEAVEVRSVQRGQARAFNQQKEAPNLQNIVSAEQLERFPDLNVTESIKRVPGVSTEPVRGEAAQVLIRGMQANFHNVYVNGVRVASTEDEDRSTHTAIIPSDMVASLEVLKAITPDLDADNVSGAINIVTRRPVGDGPTLDGRASVGYTHMSRQPNYQGALNFGNRVGKLDYFIGGTYQLDNRATEDIRHDWGVEDFGAGNVDVLAGLRPSYYQTRRERVGLYGQLDYNFNERSSLFLRAMGNYYQNYEIRSDARLGIDNGTYLDASNVTGGRFEKQFREYDRRTNLLSLNAGGKHALGALNVDYHAGYSYGSYRIPLQDYFHFRHTQGIDYTLDISDRNFGRAEATNVDIYNTPGLMRLRYVDQQLERANEHSYTAALNLELPYRIGNNKAFVRAGAKYLGFFKNRSIDERRFDQTSAGEFTQADFADNLNRTLINRYPLGAGIDFDRGRELFTSNPGLFVLDEERFRENSDAATFRAGENILAAYGLTNIAFGRLNVNAGLRAEQTINTYTANRVEFDEAGNFLQTVPESADNGYFNLFPMVNLRYALNNRTNFRAAYTHTIARPAYIDLAPYRLVDYQNLVINQGNPELLPSTAVNVDASYEQYFTNVGILSAGVFYKQLNNFIYNEALLISDGEFTGYLSNQPMNGENANIYGIELAWQQPLTFLPGLLSGLGIYANYSYIYSEAFIIEPEPRRISLPQQAPHIFNLALSYDLGGFSAQVSYNFRDTWLHSVGGSTSAPAMQERGDVYLDRFLQASGQLDITAMQRISRRVRLMLNLYNLTNQSHLHYFGIPAYPYRNSFHSWWGNLGVRVNL